MKRRYSAEFVTKAAQDKCPMVDGDMDFDVLEYGVVTGDNLQSVVDEAKALNYPSTDECYAVCLEQHTKYGWQVVEYYDFTDFSVLD